MRELKKITRKWSDTSDCKIPDSKTLFRNVFTRTRFIVAATFHYNQRFDHLEIAEEQEQMKPLEDVLKQRCF